MQQAENSNLLVSICSITYNHAPYIRQCLDGMLMQKTNFKFEIIINDDCSTDGTTEIIKEYEAKYPEIIKPIYQKENQYSKGVRGMFNKFVYPLAKGKYIALCEGDDYWTDPLKLQKQVDFLESHPDYSMCYADAKRYYQETNEFEPFRLIEKEIVSTDDLMVYNSVVTLCSMACAKLVKEYAETLAWRLPHFPLGDYQMWIWMSLKGPICHLKEEMGVYRILKDSASHIQDPLKKYRFFLSGYDIRMIYIKQFKLKSRCLWLRRLKFIIISGFKNRWFKVMLHDILSPNTKLKSER